MKIFTVHDNKAQAYFPPMTMKSSAEAIRSFDQACQDINSNFNKYPSDFILMEIGTFDEQTGQINPLQSPIILASASEYVKKQ